jgi:BASS family bile acid:Na+ symporter
MTLASIILLAVKVSIALTVLSLGLRVRPHDLTELVRQPGLLLRSVLSMYVALPLFAVALVTVFNLHPAVKIALVALSVSPVPPVFPKKAQKAGGSSSYAFALLVTAAVLSIVLIPVSVELFERAFGTPARMSPVTVAVLVLTTILAPLAAGMLIGGLTPGFADRIAKPVMLVATVLLLATAVPVLITSMPAIWLLIGNGTLAAFLAFALFGLIVGHLLGGPEWDHRSVLALSTSSRHPGMAIAIATTNFPAQKLSVAAVLLYLLVSAIVSIPYLKWHSREEAGVASAPRSENLEPAEEDRGIQTRAEDDHGERVRNAGQSS